MQRTIGLASTDEPFRRALAGFAEPFSLIWIYLSVGETTYTPGGSPRITASVGRRFDRTYPRQSSLPGTFTIQNSISCGYRENGLQRRSPGTGQQDVRGR